MIFRFDDFELDTDAFELRRSGEPVPLQRRVFDLVAYLAAHGERVVTKEELFEHVWEGVTVSDASLSQAVKQARKALGDDADAPSFILTTRGRGYRFGRPVTTSGRAAASVTVTRHEPEAPPPLSRRAAPFVGRDACTGTFDAALDAASRGTPRLVLLSGEAGIGKTRALDELAARAVSRGFRVLRGRCYGGDEGAPSFWPWRELLRAFDEQRAGELASAVRAGAEGLASLLPELDPFRPESSRGAGDDVLRARFRLFEAVSAVLREGAREAPIALLFDDLHVADEPSLLLLTFFIRQIREARVLVAGAYRSLIPGHAAPLATHLPALAREPATRTVVLSGLGEDEVGLLLSVGLGAPPSAELARAVHAQTGGNPFFVAQMLHLLGAAAVDPEAQGVALPVALLRSSLGDAIRGHLASLSPGCRRVLDAAAIFGDSFELAVLSATSARPRDEVVAGLGEAVASGIVAELSAGPGRYRFAHALLRDAIDAALPLDERVRLHARAADALAKLHPSPADPSFAQISWHYLQAAPVIDGARAAELACAAAEQATHAGLHEDAVPLYERALEALALSGGEPVRRVEVLLALGNAAFRAGDLARSKGVFEESAALARRLGDKAKLADAALGYALEDERSATDQRRVAMLSEGLAAVAGDDARRRALLMGRLAVAQALGSEPAARERLAHEAVALARSSGDPAALTYALRCLHFVLLASRRVEERCAVATEQIELARRVGDREAEQRGVACRLVDRLELGDGAGAVDDVALHTRLANELKQPAARPTTRLYEVLRALLQGRLDEAEARLAEVPAAASPTPPSSVILQRFQLRREQGRLAELGPELALALARAPERALRRALLGHARLVAGEVAEARRELTAATADEGALSRDADGLASVALLASLAFLLGDAGRAPLLARLLAPHGKHHVVLGVGAVYAGPVPYYLGLLALLEQRPADAVAHLEAALDGSRDMGALPFVCRAERALAEALVRRARKGDDARARQLVASAVTRAREHGLGALLTPQAPYA